MSSSSATTSVHTAASSATAPQLSGRWLVLARAVWVTVATLIVVMVLANLPVYFAQMRTVCLHQPCMHWQLTPATAHVLQQLHLSSVGYAVISLVFSLACIFVWITVSLVIVWRQSRQLLALLTSLLLIEQCIIQLNGSIRW